jgi:hypothetical protein
VKILPPLQGFDFLGRFSISRNNALLFTICPRGVLITPPNAVFAAVSVAMHVGVTPRLITFGSVTAVFARLRRPGAQTN